jgi:hypothetical protein
MKFSFSSLIFFLVLFIVWSPIKILAFAAPLLVIAYVVFFFHSGLIPLMKVLLFILAITGIIAFYNSYYTYFYVQNSILFLLNLAFLFLVFGIRSDRFASIFNKDEIGKISFFWLLLESSVGFVQAMYTFAKRRSFDTSLGDTVEGTIDLAFKGSPGIETQAFFVNILFLIFMVWKYYHGHYKYLLMAFGAFTIILSSVIHMFIFLIVSFFAAYVLIYGFGLFIKYYKTTLLFSGILLIVILVAVNLQSGNFGRLQARVEAFSRLENPKSIFWKRVINDVPKQTPSARYIGFGPGQISSRAALCASGLYSNSNIPFIEEVMHPVMERYMLDIWLFIQSLSWDPGSSWFPYNSWVSLYAEFGLLGVGVLLFFLGRLLVTIKWNSAQEVNRNEYLFQAAGILFIFLIGFQDNYWEMPQVVFFGIFALKILIGESENELGKKTA